MERRDQLPQTKWEGRGWQVETPNEAPNETSRGRWVDIAEWPVASHWFSSWRNTVGAMARWGVACGGWQTGRLSKSVRAHFRFALSRARINHEQDQELHWCTSV
ncbi:MAG: hypothetical protein QOK39_786 [Acidimicrobiaceae bacterium]|nr:hypothetical protein [Acidimicrobiaceae bacterium]